MSWDCVNLCHLSVLVAVIFSKPRTKEDCSDECGGSTNRMDCCSTCEIYETKFHEPSLWIPYPSGLNRIYNRADYG